MKPLSGIEKINNIHNPSSDDSLSAKLKRVLEISLSLVLFILLFPLLLCIGVIVKTISQGPVLNVSDRIGINNKIFKMYKFRTMKVATPNVATHLLENSDYYLSPIGKFLRRTSLDELPQIYNVIKGDMHFVGPRPALYNQDDLIKLRTVKGIHALRPGITGWAQINGRDELPIPVKVGYDEYYLQNKSFSLDLRIMLVTFLKVLKCDGISH